MKFQLKLKNKGLELLSNIGAIFGLLIDGSVKSAAKMIELVYFMIYITFKNGFTRKLRTKKGVSYKTTNSLSLILTYFPV